MLRQNKNTSGYGAARVFYGDVEVRGAEELGGVFAGGVECGELLDYAGTVFGICYAEPAGVGVEDFDCCLTRLDECVGDVGDNLLGLGHGDAAVEEAAELAVGEVKIVGGESPHVHRYGGAGVECLR